MASEKFANLAETTLSAGYTAGAGSISVTSAAGFPATGVFRVRLGNAGKTIFRVDSVAGTTFTGAAEANDANANNGDSVVICATKSVAERLVQSPEAGESRLISGVAGADFYGPIYKLKPLDQSGWSWVNQGGATVTQANGVVYMTGPTQAGRNSRLRVTAAPATPYTVTALLVSALPAVNFTWAGLAWRESGTGKIIEHYRIQSGAIEGVKNTNETTFSAGFGASLPLLVGSLTPHWLRITDDGTNLKTFYSIDGINWVQVNSEGRTVFMAGGPNQIGITVAAQGGGVHQMSVLSWEIT